MVEPNPRDEGKQEPQQNSGASAVRSVPATTPVVQPVQANPENTARKPPVGGNEEPNQPKMTPFERNSLAVATSQLDFTKLAVLAAFLASVLIYVQIEEMTYSNQILSSQSISAAAGAAIAEKETREQLAIAQQQATAAQDSVRAIQRQMRQDQRGWVAFDKDYSDLTQFTDDAPLVINVKFINFGKTPVKNIRGVIEVNELSVTQDPDFHYVTGHPRSGFHIGIIYPTENFANTTVAYELTHEAKPAILSPGAHERFARGELVFAIHGKITYYDIFDQGHWLTFCHIMSANPLLKKESCTNHNNVDDN